MKKIDAGQTISILANLGVIAGIIFLAVELRQNTTATQLMASGSASAYIRDLNNMLAENGELAALIIKADESDSLSRTENLRMASFLSSTYVGWHAYRRVNIETTAPTRPSAVQGVDFG
jgi:hypothetical protein